MATFAERFKIALDQTDITAAELSRRLNIPEGTISQYKSGAYEPKQRRLELIANTLGVSISWLMGADSEKPVPKTEDELDAAFIKDFGRLTPEEQKIIHAQIKGILSSRK